MKKYPGTAFRAPFRKLFRDFSGFFCVRTLALVLALVFTSFGCTRKAGDSGQSDEKIVNLAIWGNYLLPAEQARFEQLTGIKIQITNYSSNEELLAKIQAGAGGIDVAIPSDYMVGIMIAQGFLSELDKKQIPNLAQVDPEYLSQDYDLENRFSVPYAWSTTGLAIQRDLFSGELKSWKQVAETPDLKARISLLDDAREVISIGLRMAGLGVNSQSVDDLTKAKENLTKLKPQIKMFRSDVIDALTRKEIAVAHAFSTEALQAWKKTGGKVDYVLAEEGGTKAIDNAVVLKNARHLAQAHALINFFLSQESNVKFVEHILAGPVVKGVKEKLPADLQKNKALFPDAESLKKLERIKDVGPRGRDYDRLWTEFKSL